MGSRFFAVTFLFIICSLRLAAQQASISGKVKTKDGKGIDGAIISVEGENIGGSSDASGKYHIEVPANKPLSVVFTYIAGTPRHMSLTLKPGEKYHYDAIMDVTAVMLKGHTVHETRSVNNAGDISIIDPTNLNQVASTTDGLSRTIQMMAGGKQNELSSQYTVRGGNYDENLVYVNDFEIYRPFLVRSGQQEGLSFVNSDLVSNVSFSLGGFQAKYGDKMSSVLDVTYRRPTHFAGTVTASLLGASLSLEGATKNQKLTYLIGLRQKSNQYLLQAQPTKGVYNPSFTDAQALINYRINDKWEVEAIANYARNRFTFYPTESIANFGELTQAYQVHLFYSGGEIDQFDSRFGGFSTTYRHPNHKLRLKMLVSGFQTNESETYDITGEYLFGELETDLGKTNFGQIKDYLGTGVIQDYARNYLKVNVATVSHRGWYDAGKHNISWGLDASYNSINDKLHEWERRDSGGFSQPYIPSQLEVMDYYDGSANFSYMRYYGFLQDNFSLDSAHRATVSAGVRYSYSTLNNEFILSPRFQFNYKLNSKLFFKAAAGMYAQPPFYREMRDMDGNLNKDLLAQKSTHFLAGLDYTDSLNGRPYKLTGELYYKHLWDLVPYVYDDVRIRYYGRNDAVGYAAGGEVRLYGDIVKDATSWISLGVMKTEENLLDDSIVYHNTAGADSAIVRPGYIPRPSDQRLNIGMYFQDYLPHNKNFQVHLSLQYATGLPYGPPNAPRAADTLRLPAYKRVDIGFSALLLDGKKKNRPAHSFFNNVGNIWASLEVFNLLGIQNTLSYTWIQDQSSGKTFAVPNRLTSRLVNVKIIVKF